VAFHSCCYRVIDSVGKMDEALLEPVPEEVMLSQIAESRGLDSPLTPTSALLTARAQEEGASGFSWTDMVHITGARDAAERLKNYWESIGVTAALLCAMAFSGLYTGPIEFVKITASSSTLIIEIYVLLMGASFLCTLAAVILSILLHSRLNGLPRDADVKWFILEFADVHLLPTRFFQAGCFFIVIATMVGVHALYPLRVSIILWLLGLALITASYLGYVHIRDKTDSRLANAISNMAQLRQVFKQIDADHGGTLDVEELQAALEADDTLAGFLGVTKKHVEKVFDRIDQDGGGEITWEEFKVFFGN